MAEEFFSKIPAHTLKRLESYVTGGALCTTEESKEAFCGRITAACSVLYDCGILTFSERVLASAHFRSRVYARGGV